MRKEIPHCRPRYRTHRALLLFAVMLTGLATAGCAAIASSAAGGLADNLSLAILNQDDPETVRDGAPAYLLLIDSLVQGSPENEDLLRAAATLYTAYGSIFVEDPERAARLTDRARRYAERGMCLRSASACELGSLEYAALTRTLAGLGENDLPMLYTYSVAWLGWIRAHSDDWVALADLPKVEAALQRVNALDDRYENGSVHLYLGILNTLRPPALGGKPEVGREHFEKAIEISGGRDLSAKVEYARSYARMLYERDLHDRLLTEVLESAADVPGLTLLNSIARREAAELLASADDYF